LTDLTETDFSPFLPRPYRVKGEKSICSLYGFIVKTGRLFESVKAEINMKVILGLIIISENTYRSVFLLFLMK
jgi:hypothetical protein